MAARLGGGDPGSNPRLRLAMEKAREANMPNDNLERAIKRGAGLLEGAAYLEVRYEGYGVGGAAVLVDCLTDNKNRTLPEVRRVFVKYGGNLGTDGSVSYLFKRCGQLLFASLSDEAQLMDVAVANNAADFFSDEEGGAEILCAAEDFPPLLDAVRAAGFAPDEFGVVMRADSDIILVGEEGARMQKMLDALEELDDTQQIYTNADIREGTS